MLEGENVALFTFNTKLINLGKQPSQLVLKLLSMGCLQAMLIFNKESPLTDYKAN